MKDFSVPWFTENARIISREIDFYCTELSEEQLNWKSHKTKWNIAQCLHHLIKTNQSFIPIFHSCDKFNYNLPFNWVPKIPKILGDKLLFEMAPGGKPMFSPPKWKPGKGRYKKTIISEFTHQQRELINAVESIGHINFKTQIIASPTFSLIHYSLNDSLQMLIFHEQRHLEQIKRIIRDVRFPEK